jgi:hypothetical protein
MKLRPAFSWLRRSAANALHPKRSTAAPSSFKFRSLNSVSQSIRFKPFNGPFASASLIHKQSLSTSSPLDGGSESKQDSYTRNIVGYWFLLSGALVFTIVIVGGVTRLTESGLSIVEWNLIKGMRPPSSEDEWNTEFEKYKKFPEFIK